MVNWKNSESTDRLIAALIVAHPSLRLDYQAIAAYFGQGATYDAIEGRFRRYRRMADELKNDAHSRGITHVPKGRASGASTPRTPRNTRGITKNSSSGKGRNDSRSNLTSPSRRRVPTRSTNAGMSSLNAICLDGDTSDDDEKDIKFKTDIEEKLDVAGAYWRQSGAAPLCQGSPDVEIVGAPVAAEPVGARFPKLENRENSISNFSSLPAFGRIKEHGRVEHGLPSAAPPFGMSSRHGATLGRTGMAEDPFHHSDLYFPTNHASYPMDTMYFDDYDGMA